MKIIGNIHSDVGIKKNVNQDAACLKVTTTFIGETALAVVCDGMGGFAEGELASSSIILAFAEWMDKEFPQLLKNGISFDVLRREWLNILQDQNQKLCDYGAAKNLKIGSTITAMLVLGKKYYLVNVGDSRTYAVSENLNQLTEDQTLVNKAVLDGKLTREQARNHPKGHILSECVGVTETIYPDFYEGIFDNNTTYMLCSDGFTHEVSDQEIYEAFKPSKIYDLKSTKIEQYNLTELCKSRGEKDNITVVVLKSVEETEDPSEKVTKVLYPENDDLNIYVVHSNNKL